MYAVEREPQPTRNSLTSAEQHRDCRAGCERLPYREVRRQSADRKRRMVNSIEPSGSSRHLSTPVI